MSQDRDQTSTEFFSSAKVLRRMRQAHEANFESLDEISRALVRSVRQKKQPRQSIADWTFLLLDHLGTLGRTARWGGRPEGLSVHVARELIEIAALAIAAAEDILTRGSDPDPDPHPNQDEKVTETEAETETEEINADQSAMREAKAIRDVGHSRDWLFDRWQERNYSNHYRFLRFIEEANGVAQAVRRYLNENEESVHLLKDRKLALRAALINSAGAALALLKTFDLEVIE